MLQRGSLSARSAVLQRVSLSARSAVLQRGVPVSKVSSATKGVPVSKVRGATKGVPRPHQQDKVISSFGKGFPIRKASPQSLTAASK